ncbi:PPE domain-containing protein [[Mycobacterium] kokjensenii]|uniref:PPE domain-containing protein n=1 Tax=[Mycobacterium] kokjensenii TaxID=3064287 RepID=A0ABM9L8F5_9MYCO|nr:PPE domain-containing protein [Mycolicibacter sp. MU0083]CAJ1494577.1 PPE domain-containing protein [Mycolicibacter sp. MU0083]
MNFAALPPEVNSGLMYTGPGAGPMLAAASAWSALAAELHAAAAGYESVVAELTGTAWSGPSAAAMTAAAAPYVAWLNLTAGQAEKTGLQAQAAVAAYEAAFALTVPPSVVAANRAQLLTLLATNVLGQNAAAIAATEAQYGEMWAQDATAMYGYAALAGSARELEPFQPPPQTANPAGPLGQTGGPGDPTGNLAQTVSSRLASALNGPGAAEATPGLAPDVPLPTDLPSGPFDWLGVIADELGVGVALPLSVLGVWLAGAAMYFAEQDSREIFDTQDILRAGQRSILETLDQLGVHGELPSIDTLRVPHVPVVAAIGEGFPIGALSTPIGWAEAAPEIRHVSYSTPLSSALPSATPGGMGTAFGQMALAGMGGSALAGAMNQRRADSGKQTAVAAGAAGSAKKTADSSEPTAPGLSPLVSVGELAAGIRELGELHDAGYLTGEEFAEQKRRLLAR